MDALRNIIATLVLVAAASARAQPLLSVSTQPAFPGGTVNVPVTLSRVTNVVAAQFDVTFDPNRVSSSAALPIASSGQTVVSHEIAPGVRRVVVFSRQNTIMTNRAVAGLPFTVSPTEYNNSGPLTPANPILAKRDATSLAPVGLSGGTIFVRPVNRLPDGHVQFFLPSTPDRRYYIQASTDLRQWSNISTNIATGSFLDLIDVDAASYDYRFYRWQAAD